VNIAVAEFEKSGNLLKCFGHSFDEKDNAIHILIEALIREGIPLEKVRRVYSEWKPSQKLEQEIARMMPNAALTWSFEEGDEEQFDRAMKKLYERKWWQFWKKKP
jgi:hypothetical protein